MNGLVRFWIVVGSLLTHVGLVETRERRTATAD